MQWPTQGYYRCETGPLGSVRKIKREERKQQKREKEGERERERGDGMAESRGNITNNHVGQGLHIHTPTHPKHSVAVVCVVYVCWGVFVGVGV